jgi:hypothetical protein
MFTKQVLFSTEASSQALYYLLFLLITFKLPVFVCIQMGYTHTHTHTHIHEYSTEIKKCWIPKSSMRALTAISILTFKNQY